MQKYLSALVILALVGCATAARGSGDETKLATLVERASGGKAHLVSSFDGPKGLTGVVIQGNAPGANSVVAWATNDGEHLLVGSMYDLEGTDQTAVNYGKYVQGGPLTPDELYQHLARASGVTQYPEGDRVLYVMADANCTYCHLLYEEVTAEESVFRASHVRVRWVMVAALGEDSVGRGAAILGQGVAGLKVDEDYFNAGLERGGIDPSSDAELQQQVRSNTKLLGQTGKSEATPTLVWRGPDGVHVAVGAPNTDFLATIVSSIQAD